jgi:hypothetical protein
LWWLCGAAPSRRVWSLMLWQLKLHAFILKQGHNNIESQDSTGTEIVVFKSWFRIFDKQTFTKNSL